MAIFSMFDLDFIEFTIEWKVRDYQGCGGGEARDGESVAL